MMNNNEPITLGKVKRGKTGKPLVVLIVFLFAGSIILFLPTISNYFGDYNLLDLIKNGQIIDFFMNHDSYQNRDKNDKTSTNTINKDEPKLINSKTVIEYNNFTLSDFKLEKDNITYKIITSNNINFDESNYYLILEKDDKKIYTIKLQTKERNAFKFTSPLTDTVGVKGYVKVVNDNEYPAFTLSSDETGTASLYCKKDSYNYEYIFTNNLLTKVRETYNYIDSGERDQYYRVFERYSNLSNKINSNGGISEITETYTGFTLKTEIDLATYPDKINSNYYSLNTKSNKINFEMEAKGFDCK